MYAAGLIHDDEMRLMPNWRSETFKGLAIDLKSKNVITEHTVGAWMRMKEEKN